MSGPFITLEGPEGAGKTIQAKLLAEYLESQGWTVLLTREPGGTRLGDALRAVLLGVNDYDILPESEVLLLAAGRAQHVRERILPALESGMAVVCDRFADSSLAYQGGGRGLSIAELVPIQRFATGGLEPDLRFLIDIPVHVGLQRRYADATTVNRIDRADRDFHERVRSAYLHLAKANPGGWSVLDGRQSVASVASKMHTEVHTRVLTGFTAPASGPI